jgi:26S proteasome regulatory subunit N7
LNLRLIEEGGDWDRRNRLKVYQGLYSIVIRDFSAASKHFLDTVATFTSYELMNYDTFVIYTILSTMVSLPRPELRDKVIKIIKCSKLLLINKVIIKK